MKKCLSAVALSLLALVTTAPEAAAAHATANRVDDRSLSTEVLELRNEWRRDVRFTISRADQRAPFEFRLDRVDRRRQSRSRLEVGPVAPGRTVSVVVVPDSRVSSKDLRGRVLVTVHANDRRGRELDRYSVPVDLRHRADRDRRHDDDRQDRYDRRDRYDRNDRNGCDNRYDDRYDRNPRNDRQRSNAAWAREHRGHRHGRNQVCNFRGTPRYGQALHARDLFRFVIAARHRR